MERKKKAIKKKRRALLHISEVGKWKIVFGNIANLIKAVGMKKIQEIVVLANVDSVLIARDPVAIAKIEELFSLGKEPSSRKKTFSAKKRVRPKIRFYFCRNSLVNFGIDEKSLPKSIKGVDAGIEFLTNYENRRGVCYVKI